MLNGTGIVNMEIQGGYQLENCIKRGMTIHGSYWSVKFNPRTGGGGGEVTLLFST